VAWPVADLSVSFGRNEVLNVDLTPPGGERLNGRPVWQLKKVGIKPPLRNVSGF